MSAPSAPTSVSVSKSGTTATVTWAGDGSGLICWIILRSSDGKNYVNIGQAVKTANTFSDGAALLTQYWYIVQAYASGGATNSDPFLLTNAIIPPSPPAAPSALTGVKSGSTITLTWTGNSAGLVCWTIQRSTDGVNFTAVGQAPPNTTTFTDGAASGNQYTYRVGAYKTNGIAFTNLVTVGSVTPPVITLPTQSVAQAALANLMALISGKTPASNQNLYSVFNHSTSTYTRNTACFLNGVLGAYSRAVYNSQNALGNFSNDCPTYMGGITCQTSTHVWLPQPGTVLRWSGNDGQTVERTIVSGTAVPYSNPDRPDIAQFYINDSMPTVEPMKYLDPNWKQYMGSNMIGVPTVWIDRDGRVNISDIGTTRILTTDNTGRKGYQIGCNQSKNPSRQPWYFTLQSSGDSGSIILDNQLVLLATLTGYASGFSIVGGDMTYYDLDNWLNPDWTTTSIGVQKYQQGWRSLVSANDSINNANFSSYTKQ